MKNIPDKIWLVTGLSNTDEEVEDFKELSEVTWSEEKIFDRDIPFERAINKNNLWHSVADGDEPLSYVDCLFSYGEDLIDKGFMLDNRCVHLDNSPMLDIEDVKFWIEIPQLPSEGGEK